MMRQLFVLAGQSIHWKIRTIRILTIAINRVTKIVRYLTDILDMEQPIAWDLKRIYDYLVYDLSRIKAGRERRQSEIGRIRHILSELREAFDGASKKVNDMHMVKEKEIRG